MKKSATPAQNASSVRLTREDWLNAAFQAVVRGGFGEVRVLSLAQSLQVTRGSFYWHFSDHAELISALIARWQGTEIALDASWRAKTSTNPEHDLEQLLDAALAQAGSDFENMRFELALRNFSRQDDSVAQILVKVDQARLALFSHKFRRIKGDDNEANNLAVMFYLAIAGCQQALSRPHTTDQTRNYLKGVIATYLFERQTEA